MSEGRAAPASNRPAVRQLLLDNGLQAVWEADHRQPLVAIEARIKGGLRGEGRYVGTGITHFIEHMLFKGTPSRPPGSIDQEVRRYGGTINAFTSFDTTGVSLFVESRYLKEALGLLADILEHAVFEQGEFEKERAVIISEIQMNLDDPDRLLQQLFWSRHYLEHPYRHPILGYQPLLERLTVKDLSEFYAAEYQPQHVVIACTGDLDAKTFPDLVKTTFGSWARGTTDPTQSLVPFEPPAASAKDATIQLSVQATYAMMGFSSTRLSDPDLYPLDVLANIVGDGLSSRLYETVVRQRQLADAISTWNYTPYDPGIFAVSFRTDLEKLDATKHAVLGILEQVRRRGVSAEELAKAKRAVSADYLFNLQTIESTASDLASSLMATGDPLFSRRYVEGVARVTREQVQDVARRYCDVTKMTTAAILPLAPPAASEATPAVEPVTLSKTTLPNGLTTIVGVDRHLPLAAVVIGFRGGVRVERDTQQGLCNLVAQLLTKGTQTNSALEIARQVESLGADLKPFSGRDGFGLSLQLLSQDLPQVLALITELVNHSAFPEREVEIQRQLITKQLQAQDDEVFDVGGRLLRRTLFQRHPYRFDPLGDRQVIARLTREDCVVFAKQWLTPANAVIGVFGDVDVAAVERELQQLFKASPAQVSAWPDQLTEDPLAGVRQASRTMDKAQAVIMLGFRGSTYRAEDRYALDVMTSILSGMSGRLFQSVREAHGLSYTLGAVHVPGWDPGYLLVYAATRPEEQATVTHLLEEQLTHVGQEGFTAEEVDQAKRYLIGQHRMELQHLVGLAKRSVLDQLYGIGYDAWTGYEAKIQAVSVDQVNGVAKRYLTMPNRAQVVVSPNGHPQ